MPISRNLAQYLPKDRKYTELEAIYSLQLDYVNKRNASISGYSKLWGWSRKTVSSFLANALAEIESNGRSSLGGKIRSMIEEKGASQYTSQVTSQVTSREQVRLIKINKLQDERLQVGSKSGYKSGYKSGCSTIERENEREKEITTAKTMPGDEFDDLF